MEGLSKTLPILKNLILPVKSNSSWQQSDILLPKPSFSAWKLFLWRGCLVIYLEYITSCNIISWVSKVFTALQSALMVDIGSCSTGVPAKIPLGCAGQLFPRVSTGLGALGRELCHCSVVELQSTRWWETTRCQYMSSEPELWFLDLCLLTS